MAKTKKKVPFTLQRFKELQKSQTHAELIAKFHTVNKQIDQTEKLPLNEKKKRLEELKGELDELGGLSVYQHASFKGQGMFSSSTWLMKQLKRLNIVKNGTKLRLLDVGAITDKYSQHSQYLDYVSIDLHPMHPAVKKQDFLTMSKDQFDIVCLSLVINFVGDPKLRGDMILKALDMLVDNGYLYIVLPLQTINNSRYFDHACMIEMMEMLNCAVIVKHFSKKLAYYLFIFKGHQSILPFPKKKREDKKGMNNFSIVIRK
jgi:25S rRNA (adenine2142-N1)-methyltransferase